LYYVAKRDDKTDVHEIRKNIPVDVESLSQTATNDMKMHKANTIQVYLIKLTARLSNYIRNVLPSCSSAKAFSTKLLQISAYVLLFHISNKVENCFNESQISVSLGWGWGWGTKLRKVRYKLKLGISKKKAGYVCPCLCDNPCKQSPVFK
jgi:hypothetical protein